MKFKFNEFTIIIFVMVVGMLLHTGLNGIANSSIPMSKIIGTYLFLGGFSLLGFFLLKKVKNILPEKVGYAYMAVSMFKIMFCAVFFYLVFKSEQKPANVIAFFLPFFAFLAVESYFAVKILLKSDN